jgi:hypothetical protein
MPTNRTRRRREMAQPGVITAIETGLMIDYSAEDHQRVAAAVYFCEPKLSDATMRRAVQLLDAWRPLWLSDAEGRRRIDGARS